MAPAPLQFTALLARARAGDSVALDDLFQLAYGELREVAGAAFAFQGKDTPTLQPTAVVHEAWVKLAGHVEDLADRRHFYAVAARAMRQVLADHARARRSRKRGGDLVRLSLDEQQVGAAAAGQVDVVELDDCLTRLAELNERQGRIVELRFFGGLSVDEVAQELGASRSTVEADWRVARAWLHSKLA